MNGWHPGEESIHRKLGFDKDPENRFRYASIQGDLPHDHGQFHSTRLAFLPVTTVDEEGRPWGSILAGNGEPGFISFPRYTTLLVDAQLWDGDPIKMMRYEKDGTALVAAIGVELSTRRRNKLAGKITKVNKKSTVLGLEVTVNEAIGNCPKYIPQRKLVPHRSAASLVSENIHMTGEDRLPDIALSHIDQCDTVFFGTTYSSSSELHPSHLGMNIRGGRPGFVRIRPSDGRTLVLPDYSGNRIMTSLGNVEATPFASLTFPCFETGAILYVTGQAHNLVGEEASLLMFHQERLTTLYVTGYVYVDDALPMRQLPGTLVDVSPYSPPVRRLTEETSSKMLEADNEVLATLARMHLHSPDIGTFTFSLSAALDIVPGQAIILDLRTFIGVPEYRHMAPSDPVSLNDDRIRTWTVSSIEANKQEFSITIKRKPNGVATSALFTIANKVPTVLLADASLLELKLPVVGVTGEFSLRDAKERKAVMIAGGIGVTPFLAMLRDGKDWAITVLLATREPEVLVPLVLEAAGSGKVKLEVFTSEEGYQSGDDVVVHRGRMTHEHLVSRKDGWAGRMVYVCGPAGIRRLAVAAMAEVGVSAALLKVEGFEY